MQVKGESAKYSITNDVIVVAPKSLRLVTPFVLSEQNDWFEDEIKFLRSYLKEGMKVLDIGANYGVYALTIAKIIGSSGRLWAFEPTASTANCLAQSIKLNKFTNLTLLQVGLSNKTGSAKLYTSDNAEMNSLNKEVVPGARGETIKLVTLDSCLNRYKWNHLDFIKLDAEGEERNILKKGKNTLASLSPLIMFEFKHGESVNLPLISAFNQLGYYCYRLIPILNILIPFDHNRPFDKYQLNVFSCKKEKASQLEKEGWLVSDWKTETVCGSGEIEAYLQKTAYGEKVDSLIDYGICPDKYLEILNSYLASFSTSLKPAERVAYLMSSLNGIKDFIMQGEQPIERLSTCARIAIDAGARALGVSLLKQVIDRCSDNLSFEIREPFLPATNTYDDINPENRVNEWLFSSVLEQFVLKSAFSTIFNWQNILPLLERLRGLGFISNDLNKRYELIRLVERNV